MLLSGCASYTDLDPGTVLSVSDGAVLERESVAVKTPVELPPLPEYRVSANDVLFINISGRPEVGSPVSAGNAKVSGSRVDGLGNIHLPLVGTVAVGGLTIGQVQQTPLREVRVRIWI